MGLIINLHFCAMQGFPRICPCLTISPNGKWYLDASMQSLDDNLLGGYCQLEKLLALLDHTIASWDSFLSYHLSFEMASRYTHWIYVWKQTLKILTTWICVNFYLLSIYPLLMCPFCHLSVFVVSHGPSASACKINFDDFVKDRFKQILILWPFFKFCCPKNTYQN